MHTRVERTARSATPPRAAKSEPSPMSVMGRSGAYGSAVARAQARAGNRAAGRVDRSRSTPIDPRAVARRGLSGQGGPLPFLSTLQRRFGAYDLGSVTAHRDRSAQRATATLGARAYATGERVAFGRPPDLRTAAHEATHILQQRAGLRLSGGVGRRSDRHERLADTVARHVRAGRSVEGLLDRSVGRHAARPGRSRRDAPVQMDLEVDRATREKVLARIEARKGVAVESKMKKRGTKLSATGVGARGVASMASDPIFEMVAQSFELRLGALAHEHERAKAVCDLAARRIASYLWRKHFRARRQMEAIGKDLARFGIDKASFSGSVGKSYAAMTDMLLNGSVASRVGHVEAFTRDLLAVDLKENKDVSLSHARGAGFDARALSTGAERVKKTGDKWKIFDIGGKGAGARQWHSRMLAGTVEGKPVSMRTVRERKHIVGDGPIGLDMKMGGSERKFQDDAAGPGGLAWAEGARRWALNEMDAWVYTQRQLSMPLAAGPSGTAARIMQAFKHLGITALDDVRLAIIGFLVPARHHALVEVMYGAAQEGASGYRRGPMMYRDIRPLTAEEIAEHVGPFPDEVVDPRGMHGGFRRGAPRPDLSQAP